MALDKDMDLDKFYRPISAIITPLRLRMKEYELPVLQT